VPRLDLIDDEIVSLAREHGPLKLWTLLNVVAADQGTNSRAEGREARRILWDRVRRLKRLKVIFGVGRNEIATAKPTANPLRPRTRRRKGTVGRSPGVQCVSAVSPADQYQHPEIDYPVAAKVVQSYAGGSWTVGKPEQSECVVTPEQVSAAARALATLPRKQPRKLTGLLHGRRCRRGQPVLLPGGRRAFVWGCKRGKVVWSVAPNEISCEAINAGVEWGVLPEDRGSLEMNAATAVLGQGKRGTKEAASDLKAAAARLNGCRPARDGRKRGRPRTLAIGKGQHLDSVRR
jgi:hypothetical protein